MLEDMQIEGAVVVARWYGGVLLGPVRFTHIETCAKAAILRSRGAAGDSVGEDSKRQKMSGAVQSLAQDRKRLEQTLTARDKSINILRGLLAEKLTVSAGDTDEGSTLKTKSAVKLPVYGNMPVVALERLEKARDATLAWLLSEIDKAELKAKVFEETVARNAFRGSAQTALSGEMPAERKDEDDNSELVKPDRGKPMDQTSKELENRLREETECTSRKSWIPKPAQDLSTMPPPD